MPARLQEEREHRPRQLWRRLESGLWTGPIGHAVGGAIDLVEALTRYWLMRARGGSPKSLGQG